MRERRCRDLRSFVESQRRCSGLASSAAGAMVPEACETSQFRLGALTHPNKPDALCRPNLKHCGSRATHAPYETMPIRNACADKRQSDGLYKLRMARHTTTQRSTSTNAVMQADAGAVQTHLAGNAQELQLWEHLRTWLKRTRFHTQRHASAENVLGADLGAHPNDVLRLEHIDQVLATCPPPARQPTRRYTHLGCPERKDVRCATKVTLETPTAVKGDCRSDAHPSDSNLLRPSFGGSSVARARARRMPLLGPVAHATRSHLLRETSCPCRTPI